MFSDKGTVLSLAIGALLAVGGCSAEPPPRVDDSAEPRAAAAPVAAATGRVARRGAGTVQTETSNPAPWVRFRDEARQRGLTYAWPRKPRPMRNLEAFGTGCAVFDYDNDGWQDVLLVGEPAPLLYRNLGQGQFEDVSEATGLARLRTNNWKGVAIGDYDGDGWLDVFLAGYRCLALLRNVEGKRFEDVTTAAGFDRENRKHWGSGAGFMDLDNDGDLDLVLLNYVVFGPNERQYCDFGGVKSGCPPQTYRPEFPELWKNEGGRFVEWTAQSGLDGAHGKALVLAFADIDNDGLMDFYIGNDGEPAELWMNKGGLRFEDMGALSGVSAGMYGNAMAAMCADWGDFDRDGHLDLIVSDFSGAPYAVFRNTGVGLFQEYSAAVGVRNATMNALGFGGKWIDFDNDGWLDISFVNGHVYDNVEEFDPSTRFRQPVMLFYSHQGKRFTDLVPFMPSDVGRPILGRGLASGDLDNDGRVDLVAVDYEGPVMVLWNHTETENNWIMLDVRGEAPNTFAYGAKVTVETDQGSCLAFVSPASSYLSSSDPRLHFGLGTASIRKVRIEWRSGTVREFENLTPNLIYIVHENGEIKPAATGDRR